MLIVGVNAFFEHPAVAITDGTSVLFAAEDERFTRIKHGRKYSPFSSYVPVHALAAGLRHIGATSADITEVATSYSRWAHLRSLGGCLTGRRFSPLRDELAAFTVAGRVKRVLTAGYDIPARWHGVLRADDLRKVRFREWDHHLSHAASAHFCAGDLERSLVVVADGAGEAACTSVYVAEGTRLSLVGRHELPHSLGHFYSAVTEQLGFEPFGDEFKVMGLAGHGEPRYQAAMAQALRLEHDGRYIVDRQALRRLAAELPKRQPDGPIKAEHADVAASAQRRLEEALTHVVSWHARSSGLRRLRLAGGTFLNCVANGKIASSGLFDEIFVQPAAHDAGTAIGAAALSGVAHGVHRPLWRGSFALGTEHESSAVAGAFVDSGVAASEVDDARLTELLAEALAANRICAVFRGRMEFGPRALGWRSLLASPLDPGAQERLNRIKSRESFRPVAPVVTRAAYDRYFDGHPDPFMLFTARVREERRDEIPGCVHVDGSARVQAIEPEDNPFLHDLLEHFERCTGHPVLINTSLNIRGRPIIEEPSDAIACFFSMPIDVLVIGNHVVRREEVLR